MSVFRTLGGSWIVILSLPAWVHSRSTGPSFDALWACVPLYISLHVHMCPMFSLDPSVVGLASPCTCWWKDKIKWSCALHTCFHDRLRVGLSFLLVHQAFWALCRSRFQQPIRDSPPQNQSAQISTSEQRDNVVYWKPNGKINNDLQCN